jgi:2-phosphosulfolactate phosphatase
VHATGAETVMTGSFVNADAVVRYLKRRKPEVVTLVPMGGGGVSRSKEDDLCAAYIECALLGSSFDFTRIRRALRSCTTAQKFFDPSAEWAPERDFDLCLHLNRFDFVLCARQVPGRPMALTRVEVPRA